MKKKIAALLIFCLAASLSARAAAPVGYLPDVTAEMTDAAFWAAGAAEPDNVLCGASEIARINAAALSAEGSNMHDLKNLSETFDGAARVEALKKGVAADAAYYLGWTYDAGGKKLEQSDFDKIAANCADPKAAAGMPLRYGVAAVRTELLTFPYAGQILDDPADFDFDYQPLVGIRVNEPVAIYTTSRDGRFYQVLTSCCSGWVRAEDVAVCKDRAEWLAAWDIPAGKRLVVYGDKLYTDSSKTASETSRRYLTMGTVLERMDDLAAGELVVNRLPLHNYAVYLPVRTADGGYAKLPALINAREKVSEDYLPLTARNLASTALNSLGNAYGWGGGLDNEDCTSYLRNVYACFGLDLPRNGAWQWAMSMPKLDVAHMGTEDKEAVMDRLPIGTLLNFPGHQMMYLGKRDGNYYVISAVSSIMSPESGRRQRTRDVQINTLDMKRANGQTWMQALNRVYLPWRYLAEGEESPMPSPPWYQEGVSFVLERDLIDAFDGGYFRAKESATRAVIVEALWRAAGRPEPDEGAVGFTDVGRGDACEKAVLWAKEQGVADGVDGAFLPESELTREQLVTLLFRFRGANAPDGDSGARLADFADAADVSAWARDAMDWAVQSRIVNGKSEGRIAPKDAVTRAELAVILLRVCAEAPDA